MLLLGSASLVGAQAASAHGLFGDRVIGLTTEERAEKQSERFTHQAELLGISVDEVKEYWADGKNMQDIAEELGLAEEELRAKMQVEMGARHAERQAQMQERIQEMVEQGIITQDQADKKLVFMQERHDEIQEKIANGEFAGRQGFYKGMKHGGGFGKHFMNANLGQ